MDINIDVNGDFDDVWDFMRDYLCKSNSESKYGKLKKDLEEVLNCDVEIDEKDDYTLEITLKKKYIIIEVESFSGGFSE